MIDLRKTDPGVTIAEAAFPAPFAGTLEYASPARGPWNIVHVGMLIPESRQIFACAEGCLRGVVLTAAEMGAMDRFSTVAIEEHDVLDGDFEEMLVDGVSDILNGLQEKPRAVLLFTSCIHHFVACDLGYVYGTLRRRFPDVDFTDCYMTPILRQTSSPDALMRRQLYAALRPMAPDPHRANFIGGATSPAASCDLREIFASAGWTGGDITECKTYDEYLAMAKASLDVTMIPSAKPAGEELERRLGQRHLYLPVSYDYNEIDTLLCALTEAIGAPVPDTRAKREAAETALRQARGTLGGMPVALDYTATTRPLGLARLLLEHGFTVSDVYADGFTADERADFDWLRERVPSLRVRPTVHPAMRVQPRDHTETLAVGQKAAYFTGTNHFVNLVEGGADGAGLWGYDGVARLASLMADAARTEQDTRSIISVKGWGCCC